MKYIDIYTNTLKFLEMNLPTKFELKDIEKYFKPLYKSNTINDVYKSFAHSLQNAQRIKSIVKFEERIEDIKEVLFEFDPYKVIKEYDFISLYKKLYEKFNLDKYNEDEEKATKSLLGRYTKGLISSARFISSFNSIEEFNNFIESFTKSKYKYSLASLPALIDKEVDGMGFALACDCLKEQGYIEYPKPDIHLRKLFKELNLSDGTDYSTFKAIVEMANAIEKPPYELDKIFYLIASGDYYLDSIQHKKLRDELIKYLLK